MQSTDIPTKMPTPWGASAGGGFIRTVPVPSQIGIQDGAASFTTGYPPLNFLPIGAGGVPPFGQDFNGITNAMTAWLRWAQAGGAPAVCDSAFQSAIGGHPKAVLGNAVAAGARNTPTRSNWNNTVHNTTPIPALTGAVQDYISMTE